MIKHGKNTPSTSRYKGLEGTCTSVDCREKKYNFSWYSASIFQKKSGKGFGFKLLITILPYVTISCMFVLEV